MVEITNIVGSGDLGVEIDVGVVEADLPVPYTEYDPDNYHGLYVRLAEDGPLVTLYRSGKYIITGGSSFKELDETNRGFLEALIELDIIDSAVETGFTIQNVVCTGDLHRSVNLNALSIGLGLESVEYEPEQFPGLIHRPTDYPAVLLVFANGSVVITGAADVETAEEAFDYIQTRVNDLLGD
jgi:transcription initiation factor TFIID TATA-box-binding protein